MRTASCSSWAPPEQAGRRAGGGAAVGGAGTGGAALGVASTSGLAEAISACKRLYAHASRLSAELDAQDVACALARLVGVQVEAG